MKKGFTMIEIIMATAMLAVLTFSVVPFIIQSSRSQDEKIEIHNEYVREFSSMNNAFGAKTYTELVSLDNGDITIEKVEGSKRLYKITGEETGVYSYVVLKE